MFHVKLLFEVDVPGLDSGLSGAEDVAAMYLEDTQMDPDRQWFDVHFLSEVIEK
jgi:hypothetical protein